MRRLAEDLYRQQPENVEFAFFALGQMYYTHRYDRAAAIADRMIQTRQANAYIWRLAAESHFAADNFAQAGRYLEQLQQGGQLDEPGQRLLADCRQYESLWQREQEIRRREAAAAGDQNHPDTTQTLCNLILLKRETGVPAEGLDLLERAERTLLSQIESGAAGSVATSADLIELRWGGSRHPTLAMTFGRPMIDINDPLVGRVIPPTPETADLLTRLRNAQRTLLDRYDPQTGKLQHLPSSNAANPPGTTQLPPIYWAAFVLGGDSRRTGCSSPQVETLRTRLCCSPRSPARRAAV